MSKKIYLIRIGMYGYLESAIAFNSEADAIAFVQDNKYGQPLEVFLFDKLEDVPEEIPDIIYDGKDIVGRYRYE